MDVKKKSVYVPSNDLACRRLATQVYKVKKNIKNYVSLYTYNCT